MGKIIHCEQGTPEWFKARLGSATASNFADILPEARVKGAESKSREAYRKKLAFERYVGRSTIHFENVHTRRGNAKEPYARTAYALRRDVILTQVGFMLHDTLPFCGASLDSYVDEEGHIEIKCPTVENHYKLLTGGSLDDYVAQMQGQMFVRGPAAKWCDFISFADEEQRIDFKTGEVVESYVVPEELQLFVKRVPRDDEYIAKLEAKIKPFLDDVAATVEAIAQLREAA